MSQSDVTMVLGMPWPDVQAAIGDVINPTLPTTYQELLELEFRELRNAAERGAPAQPSPTPGAPPFFEVIKSAIQNGVAGVNGTEFRIAPLSRLRVVMVQKGYNRIDRSGRHVSNAFPDPASNRTWYPGVELFGEGLFVQLDPGGARQGLLQPTGAEAMAWEAAWRAGSMSAEKHPVHVWWHTLAHRLINALAVDSGYSAASIRERIYWTVDQAGVAHGGVLLYTVQPGGDGTLGGLISLASSFADVLRHALRDDLACSNDPLCSEERFDPSRVNGSACYACLLVSETSCEHRNQWLDRNLLLHNCP